VIVLTIPPIIYHPHFIISDHTSPITENTSSRLKMSQTFIPALLCSPLGGLGGNAHGINVLTGIINYPLFLPAVTKCFHLQTIFSGGKNAFDS
jgi:hypothetical protein